MSGKVEKQDVSSLLFLRWSAYLQDIAATLGYTDASSFARAFRRWIGSSPRLTATNCEANRPTVLTRSIKTMTDRRGSLARNGRINSGFNLQNSWEHL